MNKRELNQGKPQGFVLVSIIMLSVILEGFATASLLQQLREFRMFRFNQMKTASIYAAQGAIEQGLFLLADRIANFAVTQINPNTDYTVTYSDGRTTGTYRIRCAPPTAPSTPLDQCPVVTINENGFAKRTQNYEVIGSATSPDSAPFLTAMPAIASSKIHQIVAAKQTGIFSYSIFYNSDLEALPGANMSITGKIHANGDIYLGERDGNTLTIDTTYVHSTDHFYRTRKDNPSDLMTGTVNIRKTGTSGGCTSITCPAMTLSPLLDSTTAGWTSTATSTWSGTVQDGTHGVGFVQPVTIPSIQVGGFYYNNAGLRIVDGQIYQRQVGGSYNNITSAVSSNCPNAVTNRQFRNQRENVNYDVVVTEIDISKLNGTNCSTNYFPANGLIYATRTTAVPASGKTSVTSHGVRIVNGAQATPTGSSAGLTVVTNDPLYIKGNFNTTNKRSVALISDAFNILSGSWNDSNSSQSISNRVASDTTVNAGLVTGIVPTNGSNYSGGVENYPRFLENWSGKNANISGAFINLWDSQIGTGRWPGTGSVYNPPTRNWTYDGSLDSTPPPFTPVGVEMSTKTWWQEAKESVYL